MYYNNLIVFLYILYLQKRKKKHAKNSNKILPYATEFQVYFISF